MKKTNKEIIIARLAELECTLGCWDEKINKLTKTQLAKIIDNLDYRTDTEVSLDRKKYVAEIDWVDDEIDITLLPKAEYIDRYGDDTFV